MNNLIYQRRYLSFLLIGALVLCIVFLVKRCSSPKPLSRTLVSNQTKSQKTNRKPVPVVLSMARRKDVPVYIPALGSVTPMQSITVKTQINGQLLHEFFDDGAMVKVGDRLAEIDPRPYQAQLVQFQGQLARDQALLFNAKIDLKRYKKLYPTGAVSQQTLESQLWLVKQLEGMVQLDQGLIDGVKLNLKYCEIKAPVTGKIGLWLVDEGNYVQTSDATGLVVLNTISPTTVVFPIPEDNLPQVLKKIQANPQKTLTVKAYNRDQANLLAVGTLEAIDSQIDPSTGTIKLKAFFENKDQNLFPSQFVNIQLWVDTLLNATVVPTAAIQYGTQGTFVYLFNKNDHTVHVKPVTVGVISENDTTIKSGIVSGQLVVVEGTDKLTEGIKVAVTQNKTLPKFASSQKSQRDIN